MKKKKLKYNEIEVEIDDSCDDLEEQLLFCPVCKKEIENDSDAYSYNFITDFNSGEISELFFCSKKCWEEHILREAERIRFETK